MSKPIAIGLVGMGGYGLQHLRALRTLQSAGICRLVAVADPFASRFPAVVAALKAEDVEICEAMETLCAHEEIDTVIIATPIPLHVSQTLLALNFGKHVYLEKPPCATLGELEKLLQAQKKSGKTCAVGFQLQTAPAMKFVKQQICDGAIGALKTVHASVAWKRDDAYYARAAWAGKWRSGAQPVFDGPATNALAHVVHAALFLAGESQSDWAGVLRVRGSLKKAREIESYDSVFLEVETAGGVLVRLAFTHATSREDAVVVRCEGETGTLDLHWSGEVFCVPHHGAQAEYSFDCDPLFTGLLDFFQTLRGQNERPATTLENTRAYLQAVNGALQSSEGAPMFAPEIVHSIGEKGARYFTVDGLDEELSALARDTRSTPLLLTPGDWIEANAISQQLVV